MPELTISPIHRVPLNLGRGMLRPWIMLRDDFLAFAMNCELLLGVILILCRAMSLLLSP